MADFRIRLFATTVAALAAATVMTGQAPPRSNPLLERSPLPFEAPPFDRIRSDDFPSAFDRGLLDERQEVERIASTPGAPTFANTFDALERSGELLRRVTRIFGVVLASANSPALQAIDAEYSGRLSVHRAAINLDPRLFSRIKSLYDRRDALGLTAEQKWLVERTYIGRVRAGAGLSEDGRMRIRAIDEESSRLVSEFRKRVLADMNAGGLVLDDRTLLDGLSNGDVAAAQAAARVRGLEGKFVLPLQNTTQQPAMAYLRNRDVRRRLYTASIGRNASGPNDTTPLVLSLLKLRADRAQLLGFATPAAFTLDDQMAKTPATALALMQRMVPAVTARGREEAERLQQRMRTETGDPTATLEPWDWQYYAEQVRKADYAIDNAEVRQYFELDRVLREGVFYAATSLYGITFRERPDVPGYHPDVRVFEVIDKDGRTPLGLFYADFFARPEKRGGGWTSYVSLQSQLIGSTPVTFNNTNFAKPLGGPALLTEDEVETMFHELGHALHALFSNVTYPSFSGTAVPRDFGETPSQFNEYWAHEPTVFGRYARHYVTGEPMPVALKEKLAKAGLFNSGYTMIEAMAASFVDLEWHMQPAGAVPSDVAGFENAALRKYGLAVKEIPPRYRTPYFSHIWTNGYAAGYYSYTWSALLDADLFAWFTEHGGMTRDNGQRFRDMVLSRGGSGDVAAMYRAFRGRDATAEALLEKRGLK